MSAHTVVVIRANHQDKSGLIVVEENGISRLAQD